MSRTAREGRKRLTPGTVLGVIAVVLAASGVAQGGIPAADGTITACMGRANRLHLIDKEAGEVCADSQTEIALNQPAEGALTAATLGTTFREVSEGVDVPNGEFNSATAVCPDGSRILSGGGGTTFGDTSNAFVNFNAPGDSNDWVYQVNNQSGFSIKIHATAICLE